MNHVSITSVAVLEDTSVTSPVFNPLEDDELVVKGLPQVSLLGFLHRSSLHPYLFTSG